MIQTTQLLPRWLVLLFVCWIIETSAWIQHGRWQPTFYNIQKSQRTSSSAVATTCCALFPTPGTTTTGTQQPTRTNSWKLREDAYKSLIGNDLPWTVELKSSELLSTQRRLTVRLMEVDDLESIVTMNVQEYGSGPAYFPLTNPSLMEAWLDRQYIRWLVEITCRMKLLQYQQQDPATSDHAILVGVLDDTDGGKDRTVIGMIEVSLQPLNPKGTPSPIPIPVNVKCAWAKITTGNSNLVGWITNLLVVPNYRGCGYSKILVDACEQVAKSWDNNTTLSPSSSSSSIHLHCDADPISGRIPQKLYASLGYRSPPPPSSKQQQQQQQQQLVRKHDGAAAPPPYVVDIEGVPLLFLCKHLSSSNQN